MSSLKNTDIPGNLVLVISGPTGIGKTALAMELAKHLPVEIVSADSRQIYRYMDIGTAKPSPEMRQQVPHHFIDILDPDEDYSAGKFGKEAREVIQEIFQRKKYPLVVGGSGLYIRALLQGFFQEDVKDVSLRHQLEARLKEEGAMTLFHELQKVDPIAAARTHPNNPRRVIRALEVYYATGIPISQLQKNQPDPAPFPWEHLVLTMPRPQLYKQINQRVEEMFDMGLVEEVKRLLEMGYPPSLNALNSVGYKEVIAYLNKEMDLFTCKELVKRNTRRFAKRQFTWFRGQQDVRWLEIHQREDIPVLAERIINEYYSQNKNREGDE